MPAGRWQERPLKHIELLSLFIPQRIIDQSELWCCFNNVQFTIHWLPSTHSIINFTDLFSKSTWFCTICGEGEQYHQEEGGYGEEAERRKPSSFLSQSSWVLHQLRRLAGNCSLQERLRLMHKYLPTKKFWTSKKYSSRGYRVQSSGKISLRKHGD